MPTPTMSSAKTSTAAESCMSHTGEPVIALHAGPGAITDSTECAAVSPGILPLKALRSESLGQRAGSLGSSGPFGATADLATAAKLGATAGASGSPKSIRHLTIGISDAQSVTRIVSPDISAPKSRMKVPEPIPVKEIVIQENVAAEPIRSPAPAKTTPHPPVSSEVKSEINAWQKGETNVDWRIKQGRVIAIHWLAPNVPRVIDRHVNRFGIHRLNRMAV